jgi:hypothetical protein
MPDRVLQFPPWLLERISVEQQLLDVNAIARRLKSAGATSIGLRQREGRLDQIHVTGPGLDLGSDIDSSTSTTPATDALNRLAEHVVHFGALRRVNSAWIDMMHVADAATYLATYAHEDGREEIPEVSPTVNVDPITEAGVVVMYARTYTGSAKLGDRWLPQGEEDRALHRYLMNERNTTYAHYDWSDSRALVDNNVVLGLQGAPMILVEIRSRMSRDVLMRVADLAQRQSSRFYEESGRLKSLLGAANAPG